MTLRIYAACLASYNAGILHGRWIDATSGAEHIRDEIAAMLRDSPEPSAEEWAIHDYDGFPSSFGEHESIDGIADYADALESLGDAERGAFRLWADYHGADEIGRNVDAFRDAYIGEFHSWEEVSEQYVEECGLLHDVPDNVASYFDHERHGRDLSFDGFELDGHYFWSH